ncbi:hypothetical protein BROUX41_002268 [Berkeleyomyces rouxiae]|uniref:uncharacterized protein n=1 Tax=Berkeleyomyces rouxiae TaxID=2035830 RepID=UPI003B828B0F
MASVFIPLCISRPIGLGAASLRYASSAASSRWKTRQVADPYAREAKAQGLRSRAAFKLLEMNKRYRLFRRANTVVDLGFAPGSWAQVAAEKTAPGGLVVGIDLLPAAAPPGVVVLQGDFLAPDVRERVKALVVEAKARLRARAASSVQAAEGDEEALDEEQGVRVNTTVLERREGKDAPRRAVVDVVVSDMMMNTCGVAFRDHVGSMDLCEAALAFAQDTLRPGGHFVCKFYQGSEDKAFEIRLKTMFSKVFREKPDSSRKESKEAYFVALRRKRDSNIKKTATP